MTKKALIFFISIFLFACSGKNKIPRAVLPKQEMRAVLWDMLRADEFLAAYVLPKDSSLNKKKKSTELYEQVFRIHHINRDEFKKSFSFYQSHPSLMKDILDSLSAKQASLSIQPTANDTTAGKRIRPVETP
ncbi:MAG: DUF4296 domain-containing protein [Chitinophagales bacterium]